MNSRPAGAGAVPAARGIRYDDLDAAHLARRLGASDVVLLGQTTSVLDVAHERGAALARAGTLILAEEQTAGRGRHGRHWHSPPGGGIWLALLLRPREAPLGGALAIRAGLAVVEALAACASALAPRLKWPNDVIVADRKAGGILCEARWSGERLGWVAVGVGLNVEGPPAPAVRDSAIALREVAPGLERLAVLEALVPRLVALGETPAELGKAERARFLALAWQPEGAADVIADLAPDGALLVRRPDGSLDRRTDAA